MALTKDQAEIVAQRATADGTYGEIAVVDCGVYGYVVTGRKVINGQGIGRQWSDPDDTDALAPLPGAPKQRRMGRKSAEIASVLVRTTGKSFSCFPSLDGGWRIQVWETSGAR